MLLPEHNAKQTHTLCIAKQNTLTSRQEANKPKFYDATLLRYTSTYAHGGTFQKRLLHLGQDGTKGGTLGGPISGEDCDVMANSQNNGREYRVSSTPK